MAGTRFGCHLSDLTEWVGDVRHAASLLAILIPPTWAAKDSLLLIEDQMNTYLVPLRYFSLFVILRVVQKVWRNWA